MDIRVCAYVFMCVYVNECERKTERETERESQREKIHFRMHYRACFVNDYNIPLQYII